MLASIKKWVNTHYGMLADSGGTSKIYGSLCYLIAILLALNASLTNKCQHKFQPGFIADDLAFILKDDPEASHHHFDLPRRGFCY